MAEENLQSDLVFRTEIGLRYDLFTPPEARPQAPLLIAVHGYGAHKRYMMREARLIAPTGFVIASPQAPHQHFRQTDDGLRTGFGWLTSYQADESVAIHHKFLLHIIGRLADEGTIDPSRVYLYGFSQACALNFRFAFSNPDVLRGLIGVSGGIPGDLDTNENYRPFDAETLYLYGDEDEFYPIDKFEEYEMKLRAALPNFRSKRYAAGHEITDEMRADIREFLRGMEA